MTGQRTTGPKYWRLSDGEVAFGCVAEDCSEIATIVVRGFKGLEWPLCPDDWRAIRRQTHGLIETVRTLERPRCSRIDCRDEAATVVEQLDGMLLPVCRRHGDDASWVPSVVSNRVNSPDQSGEHRRHW